MMDHWNAVKAVFNNFYIQIDKRVTDIRLLIPISGHMKEQILIAVKTFEIKNIFMMT